MNCDDMIGGLLFFCFVLSFSLFVWFSFYWICILFLCLLKAPC
jgi:hypothetical protein